MASLFRKMAKSLLSLFAWALGQPALINIITSILTLEPLFVTSRNKNPDLTEAQRILVIRPDEIGDVVLMGPFFRSLRLAAPQAVITLITKTACRELVEYCPYVDAVYGLDFSSGGRRRFRLVRAAWRLRFSREFCPRSGFDLVLLPRRGQDYYDSEMLSRALAGRGAILVHRENAELDFSGTRCCTGRVTCYSNHNLEHEVLHNLRFLQWCGDKTPHSENLELWLTDSDRGFASLLLPDSARYVAIAPGASVHQKEWPVDRFAEIAFFLSKDFGLTPVQLGARDDPTFASGVRLTGRTTLREAAAVIERCVLFVGNDSGLAHLAAAASVPVVEVNGFRQDGPANHPNSPKRFGPWGVVQRIVQPPPGQGTVAIEEVTVEAVRAACSELLIVVGESILSSSPIVDASCSDNE